MYLLNFQSLIVIWAIGNVVHRLAFTTVIPCSVPCDDPSIFTCEKEEVETLPEVASFFQALTPTSPYRKR